MNRKHWPLVACLFMCASANAQAALTPRQQAMLETLVEDDLSTYLQNGKSLLGESWAEQAVPWAEDKEIGMRYARAPVAADSFYGDRAVFIRGHYISAENWLGNTYRVQLWLLAAIVDKTNAGFLRDAHNGSIVELVCHAQGQELETAYVDNCVSADKAIHALAAGKTALIQKSQTRQDLGLLGMARWFDATLATDSPCRADLSGCPELMDAFASAAKSDPEGMRRYFKPTP